MSNKRRTDKYQLVEISVTEGMYKMKSHSIYNVLSQTLNPKTNLAGLVMLILRKRCSIELL